VEPDTLLYVIGDIHGQLDLLSDLYEQIERDAARHDAKHRKLIHLGDYIDRGPDPKQIIELFCNRPLPGFDNHWLLGNHEHLLLLFLQNDPLATGWLANGALDTLASYGVWPGGPGDMEMELVRFREELTANLPPHHLDFLSTLDLTYENGDYLFVHAGVRPGVELSEQSEFDMIWIRDPFLNCADDFGKIIVHGHSPHEFPEVRTNRICIDTGAYHTGHLTCLVLQGNTFRFLQT
jgi:serine/threonine protein phosphatase 1